MDRLSFEVGRKKEENSLKSKKREENLGNSMHALTRTAADAAFYPHNFSLCHGRRRQKGKKRQK